MEELEQKLKEILPQDKECVVVWHRLEPKENIQEHSHNDYNEFVVINNGDFSTSVNGKVQSYNLKNETTVINFPVSSKHAFSNGNKTIEYFVVRVKIN